MSLTIQEIRDHIKDASKAKGKIAIAVDHEARLSLHSETTLSRSMEGRAATTFFDFVKKLLPADKFQIFLTLFYYPAATVPFTDKIYTALHKMFDGRNPVFKYVFTDERFAEDWSRYRTDVLDHPNVWSTTGFEQMKSSINSVMIVDLPQESDDQFPSPYWYFLPFESVINFSSPDGVGFDWIIFKQDDGRVAAFDDEFFRVFEMEGQEIKPTPVIESGHDLGYCPARFFWTTPISNKEKTIKRSPLSNYLGKLDLLLFFDISNEHLNLYGRYPVYSAFSQDCDFVEQDSGNFCDGGSLKNRDGFYLIHAGKSVDCPKCSQNRFVGPGTLIEVDPPSKLNDGADLRNPVQITTIDRDSLEYNTEDIQRRKVELFASITGFQGMPINDQAVNEKQVIAIFESLEAALKQPQGNFEAAIQWIEETVCLLRYGASFVSCALSLGTEHFILSASELLDLYAKARQSSFGVATLDILEDLYFETEFRNDPEGLRRQRILVNVDPFRHRTVEEVKKMFQDGEISYPDYMIKANFSSLILRFERENMKVTEFGQGIDFDVKIRSIYETLKTYVEEMKPTGANDESSVRDLLEMYGVGVRAGAITPQTSDEQSFRAMIGVEPMGSEALQAWADDQGVRRPTTLKSKTETDAVIESQTN